MNTTTLVTFCHTVAQAGLTLFCQSGLVLLLGLILSALLLRRGPLVQSLVYRATLVAVVLTVIASTLLAPTVRPLWRVSLPEISQGAVETFPAPLLPGTDPTPVALPKSHPQMPHPLNTTALQTVPIDVPPSLSSTAPQPLSLAGRTYIAVATLWGLGALVLLSWLLLGQLYLLRLRRQADSVTTGPAADMLGRLCAERSWRPLPLLASTHIHSPFLAGAWRPTIFIPTSYEIDFDALALQAIFTHEIVHRERGDNAWMLLARLTGALLWMQPFLWLLVRRLEQTSEEVCDILALNAGCSPHAYADCLLTLAERLSPSRLERSLGAGIVPFRSQVGRRIQQILATPRLLPMPSARLRLLAVIGTALIVMLGSRLISSAAPPGSAADVVGAYLQARALGQFPAAYGLLSPQTQRYVPFPNYATPEIVSGPGFHPPSSYTAQDALFELFAHGKVTPGFRYELIGPAPDDPTVALIRTYPPGDTTHEGLTLRILTIADPTDSSRRRLDMVATLKPYIPDVTARLQARSDAIMCVAHLKQIGLAIMEYMEDHDEHFPHAAHWVDEIMPYVKDVSVFHDAAAPASQKYSYAFNRNLSGIFIGKLDYPAQTILVFDSSKGVKNASDTGQSLPHPGRHTGGNDFAFADGHVKYLRELKGAATFSPSGELPTQAATTPVRLLDGPYRVPKAEAVTLTGRVVYPDGKPAPGVLVIAQHSGPASFASRYRHAVEEADAQTGADGRYRLTGLSDDHYNVAVREPTGLWVAVARRDVIGTKGSTVHVPDLVLTHGAWITGEVTDAKTGQPLEGIQVGCYGPANPASSAMVAVSGPTGRDGVYRVRVVPGRNIAYIYNSQAKTGTYQGAGEAGRAVVVSGKAAVVPFRLTKATPQQRH